MIEKPYPAIVTISESRWKRSRWFTKKTIGANVKINDEGGIPVPGKGTAEYNCGQDAIFEFGCGAENPHEAVGHVTESVLRTRKQHGGENWRPAVVAEA